MDVLRAGRTDLRHGTPVPGDHEARSRCGGGQNGRKVLLEVVKGDDLHTSEDAASIHLLQEEGA